MEKCTLSLKEQSPSKSISKETNMAIIGLGYVGLPLAIEFGKINKTVGFDIDQKRIE